MVTARRRQDVLQETARKDKDTFDVSILLQPVRITDLKTRLWGLLASIISKDKVRANACISFVCLTNLTNTWLLTINLLQMEASPNAGIGLVLALSSQGEAIVDSVIENSPAKLSGLIHRHDILHSIDGEEVQGKSVTAVAALLTGPQGSTCQLVLLRGAHERKTVQVSLKRAIPNSAANSGLSVASDLVEDIIHLIDSSEHVVHREICKLIEVMHSWQRDAENWAQAVMWGEDDELQGYSDGQQDGMGKIAHAVHLESALQHKRQRRERTRAAMFVALWREYALWHAMSRTLLRRHLARSYVRALRQNFKMWKEKARLRRACRKRAFKAIVRGNLSVQATALDKWLAAHALQRECSRRILRANNFFYSLARRRIGAMLDVWRGHAKQVRQANVRQTRAVGSESKAQKIAIRQCFTNWRALGHMILVRSVVGNKLAYRLATRRMRDSVRGWWEHACSVDRRRYIAVKIATKTNLRHARGAFEKWDVFVRMARAARRQAHRSKLCTAFNALRAYARAPSRWALKAVGKGAGFINSSSQWGRNAIVLRVIRRLRERASAEHLVQIFRGWWQAAHARRCRRSKAARASCAASQNNMAELFGLWHARSSYSRRLWHAEIRCRQRRVASLIRIAIDCWKIQAAASARAWKKLVHYFHPQVTSIHFCVCPLVCRDVHQRCAHARVADRTSQRACFSCSFFSSI